MTIGSWIIFIVVSVGIIIFAAALVSDGDSASQNIFSVLIAIILILGTFFGLRWYHANTASGQRALTDQKSELDNGLERTVTVYTADGEVIAQYAGKIDLEGNDGGYILFDYDGKRYTYYNCFVESIAEIG